MKKAMTGNHKMSMAEYEAKLTNRMEVEKKREEEYKQSKRVISEIDSQIRR